MNTCTLALALVAACVLSGCENFNCVDTSNSVVISKSEYEQLKAAALEAKQVGRYQLHREGFRTWRLDTSTGHSCLLRAPQADWNGAAKDITSCDTEDYLERQKRHQLYPSLYDQNGDPIAKPN